MIVMCGSRPEEIATFLLKNFPAGMLTCINLFSLFKFLVKVSQVDTVHANNICTILRLLFAQNFFTIHLDTFTTVQVKQFAVLVESARV